ncbi:apolipoprotein B-100 [Hemicordylus capensis]|uniref:apolipoprotein B-100 n=1 Tax=Hemicordylus capensis TaxID=884348 RepID=UPI002302C65A|nr:apolipoprotein B-100 [Hemicordylus capensis]
MGPPQLWLLLLLISGALTQNEGSENANPSCSREATRFKHLRKYAYSYEADTASGVTGTADSRSGSRINCRVELEVPQLCNFILRTSQCTLREVSGVDAEGRPLSKKSKNSDEFAAAMTQYELKFSIQDRKKVHLYPEDNEATHILNIKRGIISALIVPTESESDAQTVSVDTVYGKCDSDVEFRNRKGNIAAEVTVRRNLKSCDEFNPIRDYVSPVALIKGLNTPLSTLISSNQHCQYSIDTRKKHVTEAKCIEKHLFLPSSYKQQYGMMAEVTQTLTFLESPKINNKDMDVNGLKKRGLSLEGVETKTPKHGDAVLKVLQELQELSNSEQNQKRAGLFYRFVTGLRSLHNSTLGPLVPKMMAASSSVTIQALTQCGTPECFGAILQILRTGSVDPLVADAVTYGLGLLPSPCGKRVREMLNMAYYHQSRASFYALSHTVSRFYNEKGIVTEEINDVANFMTSLISNECSGDEELTYLTLRAIGNMGKVMEDASSNVKHSLKSCIRSHVASPEVQKAAIQALRKMTLTDEDQTMLLKVFQDSSQPVDKRLAAYLMLMRNPSPSDVSKVIKALVRDKSEQIKSFVASHIANVLDSEEPAVEALKVKVQEALKGVQVPTAKSFKRYSRNYQVSKTLSIPGLDPLSGNLEGNVLLDPSSYVPKESMLKTTLQLYGFKPVDMFEIGLDGKNFEPTLEALFGPQGFFPDSASKALYWVNGKVPDKVSQVLFDYFGFSKDGRQDEDVMKGIMLNFEKLVNEIISKETPEARAYLRVVGEELGYLKLSDLKLLGKLILRSFKTLQTVPEKIAHAISKGTENDLFVHYIFMDNEFELPTGAGLQLQVALSGVATPGAKAGVKLSQRNMQAELIAKPSVAVEFITHVGINIPEFGRNGVQMNTNIYHESGIEARVGLKAGQLKFTIPVPKTPQKLFSISNVLHLVTQTRTEVIPPLIENRESQTSCRPFFAGLNYCTRIEYSNASSTDAAPYYPLTGETRFEVEIQPTGEVREYTAGIEYEQNKEENDLVDTLKFIAQAEGAKKCEATLIFRYNRDKRIFTSDFQVPSFKIDVGTNFRITDESTQQRKAYTFILDIKNKKIPEVTLTGRIGYVDGRETLLGAVISIPRLQTQARTEALLQQSSSGITFQIDSSATAYGSSVSEKIVFRYDNEKAEVQWNSGTSAALKKMSNNLPVDFSDFSEALQTRVNELLDHQVTNTDMTLRHIVSNFLTAANTWLQQTSRNIPYAQRLQDKLSGLSELNFPRLDLSIPEELFLRSDGQIKYIWNKESTSITIPLPFGGRSSNDMQVPKTVRTPPLVMQTLGVNMPSQEYRLPPFTIPESYTLRVPLLGTLDFSSNVYSNYYNWSAAYSLANTTRDAYRLNTNYYMRADSVVELLSYNVQGQGTAKLDQNSFTCDYENSLQHSFLESTFKFSKVNKFGPSPSVKNTISLVTSSPLGAQFSLSAGEDAKFSNNLVTENVRLEGQLKVASAFAKTTYTLQSTFDTDSLVLAGESDLKFDSSLLQATNQMTGRFTNDAWTISSISNVQNGFLTNTASLKYENTQLKLTSETDGRHGNFVALNKLELTVAEKEAALRSEYQATYIHSRYYTVLLGSVNSRGVELNAEVSVSGERNRAAHKSTLSINQNGLASSATTNLQFSPLTLESKMNTEISTSGATMVINANGHYGKHNAKFNWDGRVALTEITLGSVYQGSIFDVDSKNTLNFRVNREGLKFSNSLMGSYKEMSLEHTHDLNIVGLALTYISNLDHTINPDKFHKHHFGFQLQPYSIIVDVNNDLKYGSADVNNKVQLQLEPLKINLDGNVKGAYRGDEVKHTYTFTYADLAAKFKTDTLANVQGTALTHRVNLDVAGLSSSIAINTNCESKSLRFSNAIRSLVAPFTVTVDMHTNGNGRLLVLGEQTGQLYSKFLLKVEPLAFTFSHDYRGSTGHNLNSGKIYNTLLDNKVNVLFTPSEQTTTWKLKSQLNNNVYTQDLGAVNNADKIGVELSGQTLADLSLLDFPISVPFTNAKRINLIDTLGLRESVTQPQEFGLSLSVQYDKNKDVHVINLPFLEKLPAYYEQIRNSILTALKSIQKNLKSVNIDQYVRKYRASLDKLPQQVNDYMNSFNLKSKVDSLKEKLDAFTKDYSITVEDFQLALENARTNLQEAFSQLQTFLVKAERYIKENYEQYDLRAAIVQLIEQIVAKMKAIDRQYEISVQMINTIQQLQSTISQYDLSNVGSSAAAWVQNMDAEYNIKARVQKILDQLKRQIESIDAQQIAENLKMQVETIDIRTLIEKLKVSFPVQKLNQILEYIQDILLNFIEDYEVSEKINAFQDKVRELIVNYKIDQQAKFLMDKMAELYNQQKIKETVQKVTLLLRKLDIKSPFIQILKFIDDAVKRLQMFDYKNLVDEVNNFLDMVIKKLRSFDYNKFVDQTNNKIRDITQNINEEIRALELPQKMEAAKQYIKEVNTVVSQYIAKLRETRLAVLVDWFKDLLSSTALSELRTKVCDYLGDVRDRIYQMNIQNECQRYLEKASQLYNNVITFIVQHWDTAMKKITLLAEQYDIEHVADFLNQCVETGFTVPEIRAGLINIPAFEVSLRALREATFQTPDFIIPLTDLRVPSYQVNIKTLKDIRIPIRFTTPEFTILNTYTVPSYTIDLNEIKLKIVKTIDQILYSDFQLPTADLYFKDLRIKDMSFSDFSFPEMNLPELQIPELLIPKLNLNEFQFPDIQIPEFQLPRIPHSVTVPTFGKLSGAFRVASPFFTLATNAGFQNITAFVHSPEFVASASAIATSKFSYLAFTMTADARLLAPEMQQLILRESLAFSHEYLKADHTGEITFLGTSVQGNAETTSSFRTARNAVELHNKLTVNLQKKISMESKTTYTHRLNIPNIYFTSQADLSNDMKTQLEAGHVSLTSMGKGNWKWAALDYSGEGIHDSSISFSLGGSVAAIVAENRINDKYLKVNQRLAYEYSLPSFSRFQVESTVESPQLGHSILNILSTTNLAELKTELRSTHNAKMNGRISGMINNQVAFLVQPFEMTVSTNNEGNVKISFPLTLVGKIDFLNNYGLVLNPSTQQVSWVAEGRFNQYRYGHNMSAGNNEESIEASVSMNGDANLDFLNVPLSFPAHSIPYIGINTPQVQEYSLWEETGLKNLLKTTKQSFDLNLKAQYKKNKDMHSFKIPLDGLQTALNNYISSFNRHFERGRDNTLAFLTESYNQAKTKFHKYKVDSSVSRLPQTFRIPGYTIPLVNIEVSPFTAELPAFGYVIPKEMSTPSFTVPLVGFSVPSYTLVLPSLELPVLHVPQGLQTLKLPSYRAHTPRIYIPALGNITYDFSFKSSVITLSTSAGFFNQSDIIARLSSSSTSVIDALQYKLDGTTSLTRKRGLKLATALSLNNKFIEGNHDSTISLTRRNIEALVTTAAKLSTPVLTAKFEQELKGNTKSKPIISSAINLNYVFDIPSYDMNGKGAVVHKVTLESITSHISVDTSTNGFINGVYHKVKPFSGKLAHEANAYLNSNGARSSVKYEISSKVDKIWSFDMKENVAIEASTRRVYAVWDHNEEMSLDYYPLLRTHGNENFKVNLELAPGSMSAAAQIQISRPNNILGKTSVNQAFLMTANTENQKVVWKAEGEILSLYLGHNFQLANGKTEARFDLSGSLGGHMDFLRYIVLPVYDRSLWDILKLDLTTSPAQRQYLNASTAIVYTKNEDGYFIPIDVIQQADGFTFAIPGTHLKVINPFVTTPAFSVPFTTLEVPSYTIDLRKIKVPERLSTTPFDIGLPALPKIKFPQLDVITNYINLEEYKIPYIELTVPEYLLTVSQFTLPKTFSLGNMMVDLNAAVNRIADFDLPTITIPEQQIEIPAFKIALPAGIYLPKFGTLALSFGVGSPVYSVVWNTAFKSNQSALEHSIDFTANSPLQFLEYDLDAVSTFKYDGGRFSSDTLGTFAHRDLSADFRGLFSAQRNRFIEYTLSVDVTSPTFTDAQVRYKATSSKIDTTVSSSAGTLGFLLDLDSDALQSKIFYRTQSNPQNDVDVLKSEISFQNPELIQVKANWKEDSVTDLLQGLKEKVPNIVNAVYLCVNKYHHEHTGMEISTATLKLKENLINNVDYTYRGTLNSINELEQHLHQVTDQATGKYEVMRKKAKKMYHEAADQASQIDYGQIRANFFDAIMDVIVEYHKRVKHLIDSAIEFLKITKFQVPGLAEKHTGEELYRMATEYLANTVDFCISKVQERFDAFIAFVNEVEVKIPASSQMIKGSLILDEIKGFLTHVQKKVHQNLIGLQEVDFAKMLRELKELVQQAFQKTEEFIQNLQAENYEYIKTQAKQLLTNILQALNSVAGDIKYWAPRVENIIQNFSQEASQKLKEFLLYMKDLRQEYFDPSIVGWSVKYYEVEEKVVDWLKSCFSAVLEWQAYCIGHAADLVSQLTDQAKEFVENQGKITELSKSAHDNILYWSEAAKRCTAEQKEKVKARLQEVSEHLSDSIARLITETKKLIDLAIKNYTAFLQYLQQLLHRFEKVTADALRPYVVVRQGELRIDIPKPFDILSVYQMPQLSEEDFRKKLELTRELVQQGIDQSSRKWEELQSFIDQQIAAGQLTMQQIKEKVQQHIQS